MDMLITILQGVLTLFYNPFLYLLIAAIFLIGWQRVRRERLSFGIKMYGVFNTVLSSVGPSLLLALVGSVLLIGVGVAIPTGVLVLITACSILLLFTGQLRYLTSTLSVGLAMIIAFVLPDIQSGNARIDHWVADIRHASLTEFGVILTVVLLLEAVAILLWGSRQPSPRLINSKRGKKVGALEANRLWIVPMFLLFPTSGAIHSFHWWPLTDGQVFGVCALPIGLGFQQLITHSLPKPAVKRSGYWILLTGVLVGGLTAIGYLYDIEVVVLCAGVVAILSRIALVLSHFYDHAVKPFYFYERGDGLRVVSVIPNTPADRMGVLIGEIISRVNGVTVHSEAEFYEALQINAVYCKMDVLNYDGEVRFVKGMVHENDLHNIGLLFLEPSRRVKESEAN